MQYWLMKSEPSEYSIDNLRLDGMSYWFGVRNYQARNFMVRDMKVGDVVLFYHSTCKIPGIYGIAEVSSQAIPDETQFEVGKYFDPKATREKPIWYCVQVKFLTQFSNPITLAVLRGAPGLDSLRILQKGNRLSITPVTENEFGIISSFIR